MWFFTVCSMLSAASNVTTALVLDGVAFCCAVCLVMSKNKTNKTNAYVKFTLELVAFFFGLLLCHGPIPGLSVSPNDKKRRCIHSNGRIGASGSSSCCQRPGRSSACSGPILLGLQARHAILQRLRPAVEGGFRPRRSYPALTPRSAFTCSNWAHSVRSVSTCADTALNSTFVGTSSFFATVRVSLRQLRVSPPAGKRRVRNSPDGAQNAIRGPRTKCPPLR